MNLSICWERRILLLMLHKKIFITCLLYKLMCCDILDVTNSLYKTGDINNTVSEPLYIILPCKPADFNFGHPIGLLKDPFTKQKGKFVFGLVILINGWLVKILPFCEKAKCYHKSKY